MATYTMSQLMSASGVQFGTSGARGLVSQLTDVVCYAYTASFLQAVIQEETSQVVLGHDLRPSSPGIAAACAQAISDAGLSVLYAGAMPTPALAYYALSLGVPALVVTGSHIPFDRNGIKFYRADGEISKADEQAMLAASVEIPDALAPAPLPALDARVRSAYVQRYLDFFGVGCLTGLRIAIYEHSSVARDLLVEILQGLGATTLSLGRTDSFVPIDTEAIRPEDIVQARAWATELGFDAIVSTDGDADRPMLGDEQGSWLRGDIVGILCAEYLHADVVVTPVSSNTAVEKCGRFQQVLRTRIGSPYVIAGMEQGASGGVVVGYEANGGFLLGSPVERQGRRLAPLPTRDAVLPMVALLCLARERDCRLSDLTAALPQRYTASQRLQDFPTQASRAMLETMRADPAAALAWLAPAEGDLSAMDTTDGLRMTLDTGEIVHLRPSGNAPELRCYVEAATPERAGVLCQAVLARIAARHAA